MRITYGGFQRSRIDLSPYGKLTGVNQRSLHQAIGCLKPPTMLFHVVDRKVKDENLEIQTLYIGWETDGI